MILDVDGVSAGYEKQPVIEDVSFSVEKGTLAGIVGPNGAGKSTLFRVMTGLMKPWKGRVFLDERNIGSMSRREFAARTAAVDQLHGVVFPFSVGEFVLMGRYPHKDRLRLLDKADYALLDRILELVGISGIRDKKIGSLSGGELQMVFLAQALAQEPEVLFLDEPTSHLDIGHQVRIMDLLRDLCRREGLTVVTILHDLNLTCVYCDSVVMMSMGKVFARGYPGEVLTRSTIEEVYSTGVRVLPDPVCSRPHVYFVPSEYDNGCE